MSKICPSCKEIKSYTLFNKDKNTKTGYSCYCKECSCKKTLVWRDKNIDRANSNALKHYYANKSKYLQRTKIWQLKNKDKVLQYKLKKYNLSTEEYDKLIISQNNSCKLCLKQTKLCVDHCHNTGKVRGLLCTRCNILLGSFENNIELFIKAIRTYL